MNTQTKVPPIDRIDLEKIKKKKINLVIFGHGTVGSCLIDQIISSQKEISRKRDLDVTIFGIANSTRILLERDGMHANWKEIKAEKGKKKEAKSEQILIKQGVVKRIRFQTAFLIAFVVIWGRVKSQKGVNK